MNLEEKSQKLEKRAEMCRKKLNLGQNELYKLKKIDLILRKKLKWAEKAEFRRQEM